MANSPVAAHTRLPLPGSAGTRIHWDSLYGCARAEAIVRSSAGRFAVIIADSVTDALNWSSECCFFADGTIPVRLFPDWETLPYDVFSPQQNITAARLDTLSQMLQQPRGIMIVAADTLMQRLPPVDFIRSRSLSVAVNARIDRSHFCRDLVNSGYRPATQVTECGEYAVRGSLIDVFAPGNPDGVRIDFLDDVIDSLRWFDPETQTSTGTTNAVTILPAREFPLDRASIGRFRQQFRTLIHSASEESVVYRDVSDGNLPGGVEYYLPLFFASTASFFDYLPAATVLFSADNIADHCTKHWHNVQQRFAQAQSNVAYPPLEPKYGFLSPEEIEHCRENFAQVVISSFKSACAAYHGATQLLPSVSLQHDAEHPAANLHQLLDRVGDRVLIVAESPGYREQLVDTLAKHRIHLRTVTGWQQFLQEQDAPCVCVGQLYTGALFDEPKFAVIPDRHIMHRKARQKRPRATRANLALWFESLSELAIGCPVVHEKHGVGRYRGLETLTFGGVPSEFLVLGYADEQKLYVPISALNLITRYTGGSADTAPLHTLGSEQWRKTRRKAAQKSD